MNLTVELYLASTWSDVSDNIPEDSFPEWLIIGFKGHEYFDFQAKGGSFILENHARPDRYTKIRIKRSATIIFEGFIDRVEWDSDISYTIYFNPYSLLLKDQMGRYSEFGYEKDSAYPYARAGIESLSDILDGIVYEINLDVDDLIPGFGFNVDVDTTSDSLYNNYWGILELIFAGNAEKEQFKDPYITGRWHMVTDGAGNLYYAQRTDGAINNYDLYSVTDPPYFYFSLLASGVSWQYIYGTYGDVYNDSLPGGDDILQSLPSDDNSNPWQVVLSQRLVTAASEVDVYFVLIRKKANDSGDEEETYQYYVAKMFRMQGFYTLAGNFGGTIIWSKVLKQLAMVTDSYYFVQGGTIYWRGQEEVSSDTWVVDSNGILKQTKRIGLTYEGDVDLTRKLAKAPQTDEGFVVPDRKYRQRQQMYEERFIGEWEEFDTTALADECTGLLLLAENATYGRIFELAYNLDGIRVRIKSRRRVS